MHFALLCAAVMGVTVRGWLPGLLACVAVVPLMLYLSRERSIGRGASLTLVANMGLLAAAFEGALPVLPWAFPLALALSAPAAALPGALAPLVRRHIGRPAALWSLPLTWIAAEFIAGRRWIWGAAASPVAIGYTQLDSPLLHVASGAGVSGVGLTVLLVNASVAHALLARRTWPLAASAAVWATALSLQPSAGSGEPPGHAGPVVAAVQPLIDSDWYEAGRFSRQAQNVVWERLIELSASETGVDLLIWPEGAVPLGSSVETLPARIANAPHPLPVLLLGAVTDREDGRFNSAVMADSRMATVVFDKLAPVPLGEDGIEPGRWLVVTQIEHAWAGHLICLDSVYPTFARRLASLGADFLVVLSDDSFSERMATPSLHLRASIFRAVETGLPLVFASAHGPSAVISGTGEIIAASAFGTTAVVKAEIPAARPVTPYVLFGEWAGTLCVLGSAAIGGMVCVRRRAREEGRGTNESLLA